MDKKIIVGLVSLVLIGVASYMTVQALKKQDKKD